MKGFGSSLLKNAPFNSLISLLVISLGNLLVKIFDSIVKSTAFWIELGPFRTPLKSPVVFWFLLVVTAIAKPKLGLLVVLVESS